MSLDVEPLGELCRLTMGRTPPRDNSKYWDPTRKTKNIWISIADMTKSSDGTLTDSKEYLSDEGSKTFPKVKSGTLLLSFKLSIGKLAIAGSELQTNEAIVALNDLDEDLIMRDYLYYYLFGFDWSEALEGRFKVKGNTLNKKILEALPIKFPSLEKQREIVKKLDSAFAEIDLLEENLGSSDIKTNEFLQSLLSSAFSSNKSQNDFTKVFTVIPDSKSKIKSSSYLESGKYAVVDQGKGLVAGYTDTSPTVDKKSLPVIVFGDHTRAVKYIDFPFTAGADGTQILKPSALTNPKYGFYLVLHAVGQIPSKGYARHFGELKKMQFQLPSLPEQRKIVEKLDSVFAEIELLKAQIKIEQDHATALRQSLLNSAFTLEEEVA